MLLTYSDIVANKGRQDLPSQIRFGYMNKRIILYVGSISDTDAVHITCIKSFEFKQKSLCKHTMPKYQEGTCRDNTETSKTYPDGIFIYLHYV